MRQTDPLEFLEKTVQVESLSGLDLLEFFQSLLLVFSRLHRQGLKLEGCVDDGARVVPNDVDCADQRRLLEDFVAEDSHFLEVVLLRRDGCFHHKAVYIRKLRNVSFVRHCVACRPLFHGQKPFFVFLNEDGLDRLLEEQFELFGELENGFMRLGGGGLDAVVVDVLVAGVASDFDKVLEGLFNGGPVA